MTAATHTEHSDHPHVHADDGHRHAAHASHYDEH
jgi:hypothetical protein